MIIKPSVTIGVNYLERWHIIPRNRFCNIYLHKFSGSDDDRAMHDHPWASVSIKLKGELYEVNKIATFKLRNWQMVYRPATHAHRLVIGNTPAWTLFFTGPKIREWGFHCNKGWKHWTTMSTQDGKRIGGCGES